jgi:hypothetical protein
LHVAQRMAVEHAATTQKQRQQRATDARAACINMLIYDCEHGRVHDAEFYEAMSSEATVGG